MPSLSTEEQARLRTNEAAILAGLEELEAAEDNGSAINPPLETEMVKVPAYSKRPGFAFSIRRLELEGFEVLTKRNTKATRPGEPARFNEDDFWCDVIIEASTEESQRALWFNKARQEKYGCATPRDLVRKLIPLPGWRRTIVGKVEELAGYGFGMRVSFGSGVVEAADEALEDTLKNS